MKWSWARFGWPTRSQGQPHGVAHIDSELVTLSDQGDHQSCGPPPGLGVMWTWGPNPVHRLLLTFENFKFHFDCFDQTSLCRQLIWNHSEAVNMEVQPLGVWYSTEHMCSVFLTLCKRLYPVRLLCPGSRQEYWSCHALLQGLFPTQGSNPLFCVSCIQQKHPILLAHLALSAGHLACSFCEILVRACRISTAVFPATTRGQHEYI